MPLLRRNRPAAVLVMLCACAMVLGGLRHASSLPVHDASWLGSHNCPGAVELQARIVEEPVRSGEYYEMVVDSVVLADEGVGPVEGRALVRTRDPRDYRYGGVVAIRGELEAPVELDDFDYPGYLARRGIFSVLFCPEMEPTGEMSGGAILRMLNGVRGTLSNSLASLLHEPQASLAQALLLGERDSLPRETSDAFARAGAAHLLAVSGLHLGIVILAVVAAVLALIGRQRYLYVWLALAVVWAYAALTGMRPPVVRAALMASMFLFAELAGRQKHAPTALALAAAVIVAAAPQTLWDVSFQLSVLAMGGLVALYGPLREALDSLAARAPDSLNLSRVFPSRARDIASATMAATLAVWPLGAVTFGIVSLVGLPVSLLALPALPLAVGGSAVTAVAGTLSPALAAPLAWLDWLVLTYLLNVVDIFSAPSWAVVRTGLAAELVVGYYVALGGAMLYCMRPRVRSERERDEAANEPLRPFTLALRLAVVPLAIAAALIWVAASAVPDGKLHVVFVDVGQGDAALVRSPGGRTVLIDGGPQGSGVCAALGRHMPFHERDIDLVISTQPHADHLGGLLDVVERMDAGMVVQSPVVYESLLCDAWGEALAREGIVPVCPVYGEAIDLGDGTVVEFLGPRPMGYAGSSDDVDNNGLVARILYRDVSFLFTADVRADVERDMVRRGLSLESTVLKVAHHGSSTSSCGLFLTAVSPQLAVISVGVDNEYGHPHASVLADLESKGIPYVTTAEYGAIKCVTDGKSVWITTERPL